MIVGKDKKEQENKCNLKKLLELLRRSTTKVGIMHLNYLLHFFSWP